MLQVHPSEEMDFNTAFNALADVAQHAAGVPVYMEYAGVQFHVVVPPRHVCPRVGSMASRLASFSNETLICEIRSRLKRDEDFYRDFIGALSLDISAGLDRIMRETREAKEAVSRQQGFKFGE